MSHMTDKIFLCAVMLGLTVVFLSRMMFHCRTPSDIVGIINDPAFLDMSIFDYL